MKPPIAIRPARADEAETFWDIQKRSIRALGAAAYTPEQVDAWAGGLDPEKAHSRAIERFSALISADAVLAAQDAGGEVVGFVSLDKNTGEVSALYVDPTCARQGIGTQLMAAVEELARSRGISELHLRGSLNAVEFYESVGFQVEERIMHRFSSWLEIPSVIMRKLLSSNE